MLGRRSREVKDADVSISNLRLREEEKSLEKMRLHINKRIESASLGGTAQPIFPMGFTPPNAASGWGDSGFKRKC